MPLTGESVLSLHSTAGTSVGQLTQEMGCPVASLVAPRLQEFKHLSLDHEDYAPK